MTHGVNGDDRAMGNEAYRCQRSHNLPTDQGHAVVLFDYATCLTSGVQMLW